MCLYPHWYHPGCEQHDWLHRVKSQYEAALKRIAELEHQHDRAVQQGCERDLALQQKEAELLAAKHSVRSAVVEHMRSTPASESSQMIITVKIRITMILSILIIQ